MDHISDDQLRSILQSENIELQGRIDAARAILRGDPDPRTPDRIRSGLILRNGELRVTIYWIPRDRKLVAYLPEGPLDFSREARAPIPWTLESDPLKGLH